MVGWLTDAEYSLRKVKARWRLPRGHPHPQTSKHPWYALHFGAFALLVRGGGGESCGPICRTARNSGLCSHPRNQNKSQAALAEQHRLSFPSRRGGAGPLSPSQYNEVLTEQAGTRALGSEKSASPRNQRPSLLRAPGRAMLAFGSCLRKALVPRVLAPQVGDAGTREGHTQGGRHSL